MSSRAGLAVGVACLVVLAGCGAFVEGSSRPDVETVTPVPVPADGTEVGSDGARASRSGAEGGSDGARIGTEASPGPPGVSPDGTVNVTALASAHEAHLATRSYTWTYRYRVTRDDATVLTRVRQIRAGTDALLVRDTIPGLGTSTWTYVTDGVGYFRTSHASGPAFREVDRPRDRGQYTALAGKTVRQFLSNVSFTATVVERDGQTYYRLHAADATPSQSLRLTWEESRNYTVTVYVTPEGFVRTLVAEYDYLPRGDSSENFAHVSFRSDYTGVGSTTVERPAWVLGVGSPPTETPATRSSTPVTTNSSTPPATNVPTPMTHSPTSAPHSSTPF